VITVQTKRTLHCRLARSQQEEKQDDENDVQLRGIRHQSENIYNSIQTMITTDEKSMA
jgi:hypothetical protein